VRLLSPRSLLPASRQEEEVSLEFNLRLERTSSKVSVEVSKAEIFDSSRALTVYLAVIFVRRFPLKFEVFR